MGRMNIEDPKIYDPFFQKGFRFQSQFWAPVTAEVLDPNAPTLLIMNPAGAINVKMPTLNADRKGLAFYVINVSASAITLQTDGGAGFTSAIVIAAGQSGWVVCTGNATQAIGWFAHVAAGTQTSP